MITRGNFKRANASSNKKLFSLQKINRLNKINIFFSVIAFGLSIYLLTINLSWFSIIGLTLSSIALIISLVSVSLIKLFDLIEKSVNNDSLQIEILNNLLAIFDKLSSNNNYLSTEIEEIKKKRINLK